MDNVVLASLFISCAIKSSLLPTVPPFSKSSRIALIWLSSLTSSSSTHTLSAKTVTSWAIRDSSIWLSSNSSWILFVIFSLYSATITGDFSVINLTFSIIPSSFEIKSTCKRLPSSSLVSISLRTASSIALITKASIVSSSSCAFSIVTTSGLLIM